MALIYGSKFGTEFSKLVGINIDIFSNGFEFKSLGKKLQDAMTVIPLLK